MSFCSCPKIIFLMILVQMLHLNVLPSPSQYAVLWVMETQQPLHRKGFQMKLMCPASQNSSCVDNQRLMTSATGEKCLLILGLIISHTEPVRLKFPGMEILLVSSVKLFFFLFKDVQFPWEPFYFCIINFGARVYLQE